MGDDEGILVYLLSCVYQAVILTSVLFGGILYFMITRTVPNQTDSEEPEINYEDELDTQNTAEHNELFVDISQTCTTSEFPVQSPLNRTDRCCSIIAQHSGMIAH